MRTILIYHALNNISISESDFEKIQNLSSDLFSYLVIDIEKIDSRNGWFFAEPIENNKQKIYRSLPKNATINQVIDLLKSIASSGLDPNNIPKDGNHPGKPEDILIDLHGSGSEYKGLFPIFTIAGAPEWLSNLLNTLTGHGTLSFYIWIILSGFIGTKMSMNKKRSPLCWLILAFALKMTYDAYQYKEQSKNKNV